MTTNNKSMEERREVTKRSQKNIRDILEGEVDRIFQTVEDCKRFSIKDALNLLEIYRGIPLRGHRRHTEIYIALRRHQIPIDAKLKEDKERGYALSSDDEKSSSSSSSSDDSDNKSISSSESQVKRTASAYEPEDPVRRRLNLIREKQAKRKFVPYVVRKRGNLEQTAPPLGNLGTMFQLDSCPAFAGLNLDADTKYKHMLVHTEANQIVATPIFRRYLVLCQSQLRSTKLREPIFQLAQLHHPSGGWFAARSERFITLVGMHGEERFWDVRETQEQWESTEDDPILHLAPSPYEPGRIAMMFKSSLHVWDLNGALVPVPICDAAAGMNFKRCVYADHPDALFVSSDRQLMLTDARRPSKPLTDIFKHMEDATGAMIDSDILTFGRVPQKRDEIVLLTKTDAFLLDVRAPGRFLARETHALPFGETAEIVFSASGEHCFCYGTNRDPRYALFSPLPAPVRTAPSSHRELLQSGLNVTSAVSNFDELRTQRNSLNFRMRIPRLYPGSNGGFRRMYDATMTSDLTVSDPDFSTILAAGFVQPTLKSSDARIAIVGPSFSHLPTFNRFAEPLLVYKEMPVINKKL